MTPSQRFLHLTSGEGAAAAVTQTLEILGRDETVLAMRDSYAEGPLGDVASRELRGAALDAAEALSKRSELAAAWDQRTKVADVEERARRWEALRERGGEWIRVLDEEAIVELPVTTFDAALARACKNGDWTQTRYVLARLLAQHAVSGDLLPWRVRELLSGGAIEGRGVDEEWNVPHEIRPAAR